MKNLLESDSELVFQAGFICLPLLFDPTVAGEIEGYVRNHLVVQAGGRHFVRTMRLQSLVRSYDTLYPKSYEELRRSSLKQFNWDPAPAEQVVSERLKTILFFVMPHFVRRGKSLNRRRLTEEDLLDLIGKRIEISDGFAKATESRWDPEFLMRLIADLERHRPPVEPPAEGLMPAQALGDWLSRALEARILDEERQRLRQILNVQEQLGVQAKNRMAILLHVAESGALEIDGFGFHRLGREDYVVYKHTGEYALRDYYGRLYLFPDCRVAVSTRATLRPFVVENYKHPFLEGHDSGQEICLRYFNPPNGFSAAAVVEALREGINALLYGYSSRRRNGYHSLEGNPKSLGSLGFDDSSPEGPTDDDSVTRRRHLLDVDFDDYRIPSDHPKITSGQVEITNNFLP